MFCAKCGTELNEGAEFCSKCGTKVGASTEGQNTINQQNDNRPATTQVVVMPSGTGPLIMGLLGLFGGFIPIVKYITGLLSLLAIFIGASQRKKLKGAGLPAGKATAGIVLGTIAVLITVITIAFSALVIGSVFSSGRSSSRSPSRSISIPEDRVKRINFFTNNLPDEIQGTVWSNGRDNVEFGKNKVKFNDDWYSVKKITQGTSSSNRMFTRVYFGNNDNYVALQRLSNNELILAGYKTPAEIEAERIENERIAEEKRLAEEKLVGIWEGSYHAGQGETGMKLTVSGSDGYYSAIFDFFNLSGRSNAANGSYRMSMSYINGEYQFEFMNWIVRPVGYGSLDFQGSLKGNVLSGKTSIGSSFRVVKKN